MPLLMWTEVHRRWHIHLVSRGIAVISLHLGLRKCIAYPSMPLLILLIETRLMITTRALKVAESPRMVVSRAPSSPSDYGTVSYAFTHCLALPVWLNARSTVHPGPVGTDWLQILLTCDPSSLLLLEFKAVSLNSLSFPSSYVIFSFTHFNTGQTFYWLVIFVFLMLHLGCEQRLGVFSICRSQRQCLKGRMNE